MSIAEQFKQISRQATRDLRAAERLRKTSMEVRSSQVAAGTTEEQTTLIESDYDIKLESTILCGGLRKEQAEYLICEVRKALYRVADSFEVQAKRKLVSFAELEASGEEVAA